MSLVRFIVVKYLGSVLKKQFDVLGNVFVFLPRVKFTPPVEYEATATGCLA